MAVDPTKKAAKNIVAEFTRSLERRLRNLRPKEYLPFAASTLRLVLENDDTWRRYPPHFILHSMEANCAFYRRGLHSEIKPRTFERIMNVYRDFADPAALHTLGQGKLTDSDLVILAAARQQSVVQDKWGRYDLACGFLIFLQGSFDTTEPLFQRKFGLSFTEWIMVCLLIHIATAQVNQDVIVSRSYVQAKQRDLSDTVIATGFSLLSRSVEELRGDYVETRKALPSPLLEPQLPYLLAEKPLVCIEKETATWSPMHPFFSRALQKASMTSVMPTLRMPSVRRLEVPSNATFVIYLASYLVTKPSCRKQN